MADEQEQYFPDLPDDIAAMSDEDLAAKLAEYQDKVDPLAKDEVEGITGSDIVTELLRGAELIDMLRADFHRRADEAEAREAEIAKAVAKIEEGKVPVEPEPVAETDPDAEPAEPAEPETPAEPEAPAEPSAETPAEPVADITPEPVAAEPEPIAASVPAPKPRRLPRRRVEQPEPQRGGAVAITAAGGIDGYNPGQTIPSMRAVAEAIKTTKERVGRPNPGQPPVDVRVATIHSNYPRERDLRPYERDPEGMMELVAALYGEDALTASGGFCAPFEPYYGLANVSSAERPVRAALAAFQANRGGVQVAEAPTLASITDGVGIMTAADDETGGTTATKTCQVIDCPDFNTVAVDAVYHCLQFGNMGSRAWPEQVQQAVELTLAAHARVAEINLLDSISGGSTAVTDAVSVAGVSGYTQVVGSFAKMAAGMRSRHRMALGAGIRILAPAWLRELVISDLARSAFTARENAEALLNMELSALGLNLTWYRDGATGKSQIFGTQAAGAITDFPATAYYYAYPEGSWLYLDAGTLELGIVRDSTLNSTNDYQIFGETFEQAAFIGVESLEVALSVCDTGAFSGTVTIPCSD